MLTLEEAFHFDLKGYLVLRGVLDKERLLDIGRQLAQLDNASGDQLPWSIPVWTPVINEYRILNVLDPIRDVLGLIDSAPLISRVEGLMDPGFRLTEGYSISRGSGIGLFLHHIPEPTSTYRVVDGMPRCTYIKINVPLADCDVARGPFCVIEGSHKSEVAFPFSKHDPSWGPVTKDQVIMDQMVGHEQGRPLRDWHSIPGFKELTVEVGDAVIFTENLIHGARMNQSDECRRGLYFGYGTGACANWHGVQYSPSLLEQANARQRALLEGPYVGFRYATAPQRFALPDQDIYPFYPNSEHPILE